MRKGKDRKEQVSKVCWRGQRYRRDWVEPRLEDWVSLEGGDAEQEWWEPSSSGVLLCGKLGDF